MLSVILMDLYIVNSFKNILKGFLINVVLILVYSIVYF